MRSRLLSIFFAAIFAGTLPGPARAQVDEGEDRRTSADAPVRGFVYVEPFEIRTEFVVSLRSAGLEKNYAAGGDLDRAAQAKVIDEFSARLASACKVRADGELLSFETDQVRFIRVDPVKGPLPDDREMIPGAEARVAAVLSRAREDFPGKLEIEWNLFPVDEGAGREVTVQIEVMSGRSIYSESLTFTPQNTTQAWELPEVEAAPSLLEVAAVSRGGRLAPVVLASVLLLGSVALTTAGFLRRSRKRAPFFIAGALFFALAAGAFYQMVREPGSGPVGEDQSRAIVENLLKNIYHAFAFRDESTIFDTLAVSVDGPLLEKLYLDIRRGLELEETGGPRVKVLRVALVDCEMRRAPGGGGLEADVAWACMGNVSHWGHVHPRRNQYRGQLLIEPVEGTWKVTEVNILEEERL